MSEGNEMPRFVVRTGTKVTKVHLGYSPLPTELAREPLSEHTVSGMPIVSICKTAGTIYLERRNRRGGTELPLSRLEVEIWVNSEIPTEHRNHLCQSCLYLEKKYGY